MNYHMNKALTQVFIFLIIILLSQLIHSCDDMNDVSRNSQIYSNDKDSGRFILLNEGLFNMNNSSLCLVDLNESYFQTNYFRNANNRGMGDTGNDMILYNHQLWSIISVSSSIEVIDPNSGISIARIPVKDEKGKDRQPRNICSGNGKLYVCCFDSSVLEIDPVTFLISSTSKAGKNPDGICFSNNLLYVSNSGGLDAPDYGRSVSVFRTDTLCPINEIEVGLNPFTLHNDSQGDVYVVVRGMAGGSESRIRRIHGNKTDSSFTELPASDFILENDTAYIYYYDFSLGTYSVSLFDCRTEKAIQNFSLSGNFTIQVPYGISRNPANGNIYITDAMNYTVFGNILCFDRKGNFLYKIDKVGLNPRKIVFRE